MLIGRLQQIITKRTFVLKKSNFSGHMGVVFFEHFPKVFLSQTWGRIIKMQHFARWLEPILGCHVRIQEPIIFAINVTLERWRSIG